MKKSVIAIAKDQAQAENIVDRLIENNFNNEDISVLMSNRSGSKLEDNLTSGNAARAVRASTSSLQPEKHTKAPEGATAGAITGGVIGGTLGLLAGIGTLAIPGFGALIAAGPILAALSGSAVGGSLGLITSALIGLGIPEIEAKQYEARLKKGAVLISVHTQNEKEIENAKKIFKEQGAESISVVTEKHQAKMF